MIHIRVDDDSDNGNRRFACGIGPALPDGDLYFHESEILSQVKLNRIDCPGCNPEGVKPIGVPLSQLSGRPGEPGYRDFVRIAESWDITESKGPEDEFRYEPSGRRPARGVPSRDRAAEGKARIAS